jgi:hypothetical protein
LPHGNLLIMAGNTAEELQARGSKGTGRHTATDQPDVPARRVQVDRRWRRLWKSARALRTGDRPRPKTVLCSNILSLGTRPMSQP